MAAQELQSVLAGKAGVTQVVATTLSGADLTQLSIFNQSGGIVADKKGTTQILVASSSARNLHL